MTSYVNLRQTGKRWKFSSEAALEDFVYNNLEQLLGLTPLRRQYFVQGQKCDILATDESKRLVVLELKNAEDRYIVQQLTRYYDALLEAKPFEGQVDYTLAVCLIGVTPNIHKDNLIDRKYHKLSFCFQEFAIVQAEQSNYLQLRDVDTERVSQVEIPHQEQDNTEDIPIPPRTLCNLLTKCSDAEQKGILRVREKILRFDKRIQETINTGSVMYGKGKSKPFAELRFDELRNSSALFLWLPLIIRGFKQRKFTARMRVWTDWETVSDVGHIPHAFGRMINRAEWKLGNPPLNKLLKQAGWRKRTWEGYFNDKTYRKRFIDSIDSHWDNPSYRSGLAMRISYYMKLVGQAEESNSLDRLVDMALENWLGRL